MRVQVHIDLFVWKFLQLANFDVSDISDIHFEK